jgi:hypothetical protein
MSPAVKKSESLKPAVGATEIEQSLEAIIEKKPKSKIVKQFLQTRIDELSKSKMK